MKVKNNIATLTLGLGLLIANSALAQNWNLSGNSPAATDTLGNITNQHLRIITNNQSRMFIKKTGQVGIGTSAPTEKLDVNGNIKASGTLSDAVGNSTNWNTAYGWGNHAAAGYLTAETDPQVGAITTNYAPKWNGSALVTSNIFSNGTFVGINATSAIGSGQFVVANANSSYGGMYLNSTGTAGTRKPFYGYAIGGSSSTWTYLDEATSAWRLYNSGDRITVLSNGNVGIGTNTPDARLNVEGGTDVGLASGGFAVFGSPTDYSIAIDNNEIMARNNGAVSPLYLNNNGGNVNMCVASGSVNIGSSIGAAGYIFSVDGKAIAEEVRVELSGNWPDYVFEKDHSMMSIDDLEAHVTAYKHLPGVPTACEVENTGIDLGSMQTKTMEKLEENTLYIIQLNNKIKLLEQKIDELTSKK